MSEDTQLRPLDKRFFWVLLGLAIVTRLVWVLWIHPPGDYVFSDMGQYVRRAQRLAEHGIVFGDRTLAWQVWGTHALLAVPLWLFGPKNLTAGAVLWGSMGAIAVPLAYALANRVCRHSVSAYAVGVIALLWHPSLSNTGYFLSETPFLCFQVWSTYWLIVTLQEGRRSLGAGIVSALAFAIRPQIAIFFVGVFLIWCLNRRRLPHVRWHHLVLVALPIALMFCISQGRFYLHTGYWGGVAENANMNYTAGRCHNIVTQAFPNQAALERSERRGSTRDGRRVSLPAYRRLAKDVPHEHPLGLRPALGSETIRFVGYIGDPGAHEVIRDRCYAATGWLEQVRYSIVNVSLLWFIGDQWPEVERGREVFLPSVRAFKYVFIFVFWLPSLIGVVWGLTQWRVRPAVTLLSLQVLTSLTTAAAFFGTIRLRTPYDPFSITLAVEVLALVVVHLRSSNSRPHADPSRPTPTSAPAAAARD